MFSGQPLVSVVIVNWNGLDDTKECLKYLSQQTYKDFEIIVVDNGSNDGSLEYLRGLTNIILVENHKNLGFTGGHIAGYKAANGDFVLLLNNDAIMDHLYLESAVRTMLSNDKIGALGGRAYLWDDNNPLFDTANTFYGYQNINPITAEGIFTQDDNGQAQEVNNVSGSCVMVRRTTIDRVGYLHNPFFAYFEESDLFARMKRAGYKVTYDPGLAIWHANGKSSSKKAPTFSLYMMMRNRFRFAVRNFDGWSLRRFLKFYLVMGIASVIRSVTDSKQRDMHLAYAKAFFYNLAFGVVPFIERRNLTKNLGQSTYSSQIIEEQSPISIVIRVDTDAMFNNVVEVASGLSGDNEIMGVTVKPEIAEKARGIAGLRMCLDRGYFDTHTENLAAITAKNDWLVLAYGSSVPSSKQIKKLHSALYDLRRAKKKVAIISNSSHIPESPKDMFEIDCASYFLINRSEFIDAGGLVKELAGPAAWRALLAYSFLNSSLLQLRDNFEPELPQYDPQPQASEILLALLQAKVLQAASLRRKDSAIDRLFTRYYRLAQLRNLLKWLFSWHISFRLKLARSRNLLSSAITRNRKALAEELKHIQNEISKNRHFIDIVKMKEHEEYRLEYLKIHSSETIVFIIVRDRLALMKGLLKWLDHQGISKIVLVDNDSKFPPLVNFLESTEYQVLEMRRNTLQTGIWTSGIIKVLLPDDFYVVTDPDIIPTSDSMNLLEHLYTLHSKYPNHLKIGLGLKIDDIPNHYPLKKDVISWEAQFWKHELESGVFEAGVDTTFALYKPYTYSYILHPSLRTGEPYTAKHLPWYEDGKNLSDEEIFYRLRLDQNVNTWNKEHLPERYKRELDKQKR